MTPGQQALAEAARLESARVYGRTCPEPAPSRLAQETPTLRQIITDAIRAGRSDMDVMRDFAVPYAVVRAARRDVEQRSAAS